MARMYPMGGKYDVETIILSSAIPANYQFAVFFSRTSSIALIRCTTFPFLDWSSADCFESVLPPALTGLLLHAFKLIRRKSPKNKLIFFILSVYITAVKSPPLNRGSRFRSKCRFNSYDFPSAKINKYFYINRISITIFFNFAENISNVLVNAGN